MERCAPRHSEKEFAVGDQTLTVANGLPVHVYGIVLNAITACIFEITDNDDIFIAKYTLAASTAVELTTYWIADNGIKVVSPQTDGDATVWHNSPGR